jgi:hypothetical protein
MLKALRVWVLNLFKEIIKNIKKSNENDRHKHSSDSYVCKALHN